jgi:preprotein translocase subunit SecF
MQKLKYIDFLGIRKYTIIFSLLVSIISVSSLFLFNLNFGLDFTGGLVIHVNLNESENLEQLNDKLIRNGVINAEVKYSNNDKNIVIKIPHSNKNNLDSFKERILNIFDNDAKIKKIEFIGSEVGDELIEKSIIAVLISIASTIIYISLRFEYRFAISAAISLLYVICFILGILSFLQIQFSLTTLASLLAVMGYSLNDTIVVFDRIRENLYRIDHDKDDIIYLVNLSINQTLSRTLLTSFFTMLVILSLLFKGGETLYSFSFVFFLGILIGTYSSIYIASSFAIYLGIKKTRKIRN